MKRGMPDCCSVEARSVGANNARVPASECPNFHRHVNGPNGSCRPTTLFSQPVVLSLVHHCQATHSKNLVSHGRPLARIPPKLCRALITESCLRSRSFATTISDRATELQNRHHTRRALSAFECGAREALAQGYQD